jgi:DNA-binding FrmR family transcriptional regulator
LPIWLDNDVNAVVGFMVIKAVGNNMLSSHLSECLKQGLQTGADNGCFGARDHLEIIAV